MMSGVACKRAVDQGGAAVHIVQPASPAIPPVVGAGGVGVAVRHNHAVKHGGLVHVVAGNHVVGVLGARRLIEQAARLLQLDVVAGQIAAENRCICVHVSRVGIRLAQTGESALERDAVDEAEGGLPVFSRLVCALVGPVGARADTDLDGLCDAAGLGQGVLQVGVGVFPACAVIGAGRVVIHINDSAPGRGAQQHGNDNYERGPVPAVQAFHLHHVFSSRPHARAIRSSLRICLPGESVRQTNRSPAVHAV